MRTLLALAVAMLLTVTISAQRTPVPEPDPLRCTPEGLRDYYTGLVGEGKIALDSPSSDIEVSSEVLGILYDAGKSLQERMLLCGYIPDDIASLPIGEDATLERVLEVLDTLSADPLRGQLLYLGQDRSSQNQTLGCSGCHESVNPIGPTTEGTWTRWDEQYRLLPEFAEQSFAYFAAESILHPNAHVEPPFLENIMPPIYTSALGFQDLADIIAFLESQDQLLED